MSHITIYIIGSVGFLMGLALGYSWGMSSTIEKYKRYLSSLDEMVQKANEDLKEMYARSVEREKSDSNCKH